MPFLKTDTTGFVKRLKVNFCGIKFTQKLKPQLWAEQLYFENSGYILVFDHALGGGTESYFENVINKMNAPILRIQAHPKYNFYKISDIKQKRTFYVGTFEQIFQSLDKTDISTIIINNVVGYKNLSQLLKDVIQLKAKTNANLIYLVHDYYSVCANYVLVNQQNCFCNFSFDTEGCKECISRNKVFIPDKVFDIFKWQDLWRNFLQNADEIRTFSQAAFDIVMHVYPEFKEKTTLIPHKIEPFGKKQINIAVIGNIITVKGAGVIKEFINYLEDKKIDNVFVNIIGNYSEPVKSDYLRVHGRYERNDLPELLNYYNTDIVLIPSIWPETFSYTTAEAIALNYPVICFDIGGQANQVKNYNKGIISGQEPESIYNGAVNYLRGEGYKNV